MTIIHQAIYGEVKGQTSGHDLLAASDEKNALFRRVSGHTDLADRPEGGVLSCPVVRGFFAEDHFLLIKTFPDKSPGLRSGRVFSHVLFIPEADLHRIHNLSHLFQYHLPGIQKNAKMHSLEYSSQETRAKTCAVNGRVSAATNALLENQPVIWLGEEGYWEWLALIWPKLPTKEKRILKIGAAFGPSYVKNENLSLLYIFEDAKTLWAKHSFRVIDTDESQSLRSSGANWLVGDAEKAASFEILLNDFSLEIDSLKTLKQLEDYGKAYLQVNKKTELNHLLVLANFVSKISPNERIGIKGKNRLMNAIVKAIPNAPVNMLIALIYQSWKGFPDATTSASNALRDWLTTHLLQGKNAKECGAVLAKALEAETRNWWVSTVLDCTDNRLIKRQSSDASILWQWMSKETTLIAHHNSWLPSDVESELTLTIPELEATVAEMVLQMAEKKGWLVLHAKVATQCYAAEKAIETQLRIDTDENHSKAFQALSETINDKSFVTIAAGQSDARLHRIAGKLISENSKLMTSFDVASEGWQKCWQAAIEEDSEIWQGISKPQKILFKILDHMLAGNSFNNFLLNEISLGTYSSLKDYPQRASIWSVLPEKIRSKFANATFVDLIDEHAIGAFNYNDLESELKKEVQSKTVQQNLFCSNSIPLTTKLRLFDTLPNLSEYHAQQLMQGNQFSLTEAEEFGRIVSKNQWKGVVEDLYSNRYQRKDLAPALLRCSDLLGFFQRLTLSASGLKRDAISPDEWWGMFFKTALELFPSGPNQNGLWVSTGGDLSQITTTGTGRDQWGSAVHFLRNNGKAFKKKLLINMQDVYSENKTLKKLQDTL